MGWKCKKTSLKSRCLIACGINIHYLVFLVYVKQCGIGKCIRSSVWVNPKRIQKSSNFYGVSSQNYQYVPGYNIMETAKSVVTRNSHQKAKTTAVKLSRTLKLFTTNLCKIIISSQKFWTAVVYLCHKRILHTIAFKTILPLRFSRRYFGLRNWIDTPEMKWNVRLQRCSRTLLLIQRGCQGRQIKSSFYTDLKINLSV